MDTDIDTDKGHFGWDELFAGIFIPYILRSKKKFSALQFFSKDVAHLTMCISNDADLLRFDDLQTCPLTLNESYLLNEINHMHCDGDYGHTFKCGDELLEFDVLRQMAKFFHDCQQKIIFGVNYDLKVCGILAIRLKKDDWHKEYLVPYVRLNCIRYVPFANCEFYKGTPRTSVTLTNVNLQYMKFMCKVLRLGIEDIAHCISFEEILEDIGSKRVTVHEYWPEKFAWSQFHPSSEPETIPTIELSDVSSSDNQNNLRTDHGVQTTDQQVSSMYVPPILQQFNVNATEPQPTMPSEAEMDTNENQPPANICMPYRSRDEKIAFEIPTITKEIKAKKVSEIFYHNILTKIIDNFSQACVI